MPVLTASTKKSSLWLDYGQITGLDIQQTQLDELKRKTYVNGGLKFPTLAH